MGQRLTDEQINIIRRTHNDVRLKSATREALNRSQALTELRRALQEFDNVTDLHPIEAPCDTEQG